jgi:hypothetical protein
VLGGAATFKIDYLSRGLDSSQQLFWVGGYDTSVLNVDWNGGAPRYIFSRPGGTIYSNPIPSYANREWYTVMVVIDANGYGVIYHYKAGASTYNTLSNSVYVGALGCAYRNAAVCQGFNGLVDNFAFWNTAKSPNTIVSFPNTGVLTADDQTNLLANFLMDECRGPSTTPVTPDTRSQPLTSTLQGAIWATKVNDMMRCHGSGDPHYYSWFWDTLSDAQQGVEFAPFNYCSCHPIAFLAFL